MNSNKFTEDVEISITAANIGISSEDWDAADDSLAEPDVLDFMTRRNYDILPFVGKDGKVLDSYYLLKNNVLSVCKIEENDKIYYLTRLEDLLQIMLNRKQEYFFLSNYTEIVGLVSNVNLNSKNVYTFFYAKISTIEIRLGEFIQKFISENDIRAFLQGKGSGNAEDVISRFEKDQSNDVANHIVQYLYLTQFEALIKAFRLYGVLGYSNKKTFSKDIGEVNKLRNWIAHPVNKTDTGLSKRLQKVNCTADRILEKLHQFSNGQSLITAYLKQTVYTVQDENFEAIKIIPMVHDLALDKVLKKIKCHRWCFITAWNPLSNLQSKEENDKSNMSLQKDLKNMKKRVLPGQGCSVDGKWSEESFFVADIQRKDAIELAIKYQQKGIIYGEINEAPELLITL